MSQVKKIDKQSISDSIDQMSDQLGYTLGSALSYNSFDNIPSPGYPIAFIGLNPGGNKYDKPSIESENGKCAYYYENWTAKGENKKTPPDEKELDPLQRQIIKLYTRLAEIFGCDYKELMDKSVMANLVPFRSANWGSLANKHEALAFARSLWGAIFDPSRVKVIICMSVVSFDEIGTILCDASYERLPESSTCEQTGWGITKYQFRKYKRNDHEILLIRLPHLSRYQLLNSDKCTEAVNHIVGAVKKHIEST